MYKNILTLHFQNLQNVKFNIQNFIFLALIAEKLSITESKSTVLVISFSIDRSDKLVSLLWFIVDRKYVLINLSLLKLRSHDAVVQGNVRYKRIAVQIFGNMSVIEYSYINSKIFKGVWFLRSGNIPNTRFLKFTNLSTNDEYWPLLTLVI